MIFKNTTDRYGAVHKTLHWLIALFVLMMLVMGIVMGDIPNGPDKFWVYGIHKSLGITILALMLTRLVWKLINWHKPQPLPTHKPWERFLAETVHWGLYALLIAMPLSGWLMIGAKSSTINWFGFFVVPNLNAPNRDLGELLENVHYWISLGIWGLLGLHIAGALKHTIIDRDGTLRRMVPFGAFVLMMLVPIFAHAGNALPPATWTIDRTKSTLGVTATQEGGIFNGTFTAFDGEILFDPAQLDKSAAKITIDLGSFQSGNTERDTTVKDKDWFAIDTSPTAIYTIDRFEKDAAGGNAYIGHGRLYLKGLERPLNMPFTLDITRGERKQIAHAVGKTTFKRLDFDVGTGQWADPAMVGPEITVTIDLTATVKDK